MHSYDCIQTVYPICTYALVQLNLTSLTSITEFLYINNLSSIHSWFNVTVTFWHFPLADHISTTNSYLNAHMYKWKEEHRLTAATLHFKGKELRKLFIYALIHYGEAVVPDWTELGLRVAVWTWKSCNAYFHKTAMEHVEWPMSHQCCECQETGCAQDHWQLGWNHCQPSLHTFHTTYR